ncbi:MAG TPA: hypothetical protein VFK06_08365 [Candidatus Angelobacter sp.]|nr:hypothetical protein [Candidatus Angelobacter sp.]
MNCNWRRVFNCCVRAFRILLAFRAQQQFPVRRDAAFKRVQALGPEVVVGVASLSDKRLPVCRIHGLSTDCA